MRIVPLSLFLVSQALHASEPLCGTSPENDLRVRAVHQQSRQKVRVLAEPEVQVREGAFYVGNDASITPGYRPFDLEGTSLLFTPAGAAYGVTREPLQYVEPAGAPVIDFRSNPGSWTIAHELPFAFPFASVNRSRIFITAYNGIAFAEPVQETGTQFDAIEAATHRAPILSPLMTTARKPRFLESPKVWVDDLPDRVRVTWRSSGNAPFGYDVQAELLSSGAIRYSYRSVTGMRWGTPAILDGFDPRTVVRTPLAAVDDIALDVPSNIPVAVRQMVNVRKVEAQRLRGSDLFAIRIQLNELIDRSKLAEGQSIGFQATIGQETAAVEITRNLTSVVSFTGAAFELDGASAFVDGDIVEIYGMQRDPEQALERSVQVLTYERPTNRVADTSTLGIPFKAAPAKLSSDLSLFSTTSLSLPITETFTLGTFDPFTVWERMRTTHALSSYEYDAVAMYQSFYTDLVFYAGAYATGGNSQVEGVAQSSPSFSRNTGRSPTLLHMNQLTYNYSAAEQTASKVMLHEFGHRWLYFFSIRENGQNLRSLNPISAHPASYVHTPAAFPVYGENESSVMGGAYFTEQPDGAYHAHVANYGFSWTDLYLMGLAAPEEVPPWFYIAGTNLPKAYWPEPGAIANGERRNVELSQVIAVHGPRRPSAAIAQKRFRVLFVLVTEEADPTPAEIAKLNEWRAVMERNFDRATGGRGRLETAFVRASKARATR